MGWPPWPCTLAPTCLCSNELTQLSLPLPSALRSCAPPAPPRRLQYEKLQGDLESAASQASRLAQENSALKCSGGPGVPPGPDPWLADPTAAAQVAKQMEALLSEKCKLAAENDRLLRENNGLQVRGGAVVGQSAWTQCWGCSAGGRRLRAAGRAAVRHGACAAEG